MFKRVFVTVGTTSFQELIQLVISDDAIAQYKEWGVEEVRIQGGIAFDERNQNDWVEKGVEFHLYGYKSSILEDLKWADIIISHAGAGTTIEALDLGKILVVVPNEDLMGNHQLELANKLGREKYAVQTTIHTFFESLLELDPSKIIPFPPPNPEAILPYLTVERMKIRSPRASATDEVAKKEN